MAIFAALTIKAQLPDSWTDDSGVEIFQEVLNVHSGNFSAGIIVNSTVQADCDLINESEIAVIAGESFNFSFWGICSPFVLARAFFYWEGAGTSFSPAYLGPGNSEWEQFTYEDVVPPGAFALKIGIRFYDVTGFVAGEIQYVDDVLFESPTGNPLMVANGDFESWAIIKPEPSEFPTGFTGTQQGLSALLSWSDATGSQLPDSYLIFASKTPISAFPADGIYYPDDFNLLDGSGFANVTFGIQHFSFTNLESLSNYYFKIFPYTNSGSNINYKTEGISPEIMLEFPEVMIFEEQNFNQSWGEWQTISLTGEQVWERNNNYGIQETPCARITGNVSGTVYENQDWLISPALDFTLFTNESLSFYSAVGYFSGADQFMVKISTDYTGNGEPLSANWIDLNPLLPDGSVNFAFEWSGENDVSAFDGENVHIAFVYHCSTEAAATWQIDNILISGEISAIPEPDAYPDGFVAVASNTTINLSWIDAVGEVVPEGYLVLGSIQDNIAAPIDGLPVENDDDFSDGNTSRNIIPGLQSAQYDELMPGTTYYFKIFPYTNSGNLIDFKTDAEPPAAEAFIEVSDDLLFTDFNISWGGWIPFSFFGNQVWSRSNNSGLENTPCAMISGGGVNPVVNEDWLISPAIDLPEDAVKKISFYSAFENSGQNLQLKISTDYDGVSNPNNFTWIDVSAQMSWSPGQFNWIYSEDFLLSEYSGNIIYVAFVYLSDENEAATWGLDNVKISDFPLLDEPSNYPTSFEVEAGQKQITVSWQDAGGDIVPEGYLVQFSDSDDFTLPLNGIPRNDDLDFADGNGTVNVLPGTEQYVFVGLAYSTTYFATIIPYTNFGQFIKYKTQPDPPKNAATTAPPDGVFEDNTKLYFSIFPNPGNGVFYFDSEKIITSVNIYASNGKLIYENVFFNHQGKLNLAPFEKGIYMAVFYTLQNKAIQQRIIIQ